MWVINLTNNIMAEAKKKYKVKVIQHLIKGNQIAKSGDVLTEDKFIDVQDSLKGGFIELVEVKATKTAKKK